MTQPPMRKGQAVHRTVWAGAAVALCAAAAARRRPLAGLAVAGAAAAVGASAYLPSSPLLGRVVHRGPADVPRAALTFDDGPGPSTPHVLDALAAEGVRATFFVLGRQVERHPGLVRRMVEEGHEVASHGYDHGILIWRGARHVAEQLARTERAVARAAGPDAMSRLFRAPHGFRGPATALGCRRAGYRPAAWTRGVFDSAEPGAAAIARRVERALEPGAVILLHDADGWAPGRPRQQTADALPEICRAARERGLELVPMGRLVAAA
ncbi:polysaccharide deacetylase family protein [Miltoncostaea marina]|uniref:polysaccharide deacetylase family protein n=1 Tax=Miltoncostaea marina TaxID=2843215 RepID=UPI001C3E5147|nr:polysaccharide deacetylase family protein [Miltoncostaea marina]